MTRKEAEAVMYQAAATLTAGVFANPASTQLLMNAEWVEQTFRQSIHVAKGMFEAMNFEVED